MPRAAFAFALLALVLAGCASTSGAPMAHARGPGMAGLHVHPPVTTFGF